MPDLRNCYRKLRIVGGRAIGVIPNLPVSPHSLKLGKLGTSYGGWTFVETPDLSESTIISCGLGEDASFDVEFASRFRGKVIIVDPTPRAIQHFQQIVARIGHKAAVPYSDTGAQPVEAYDLSSLARDNLTLVDKALWNEAKTLKFYMPKNSENVSHSIVNFQHDYRGDTNFIEVEAITIAELLQKAELGEISLIKLDIEGAEIEVILDMLGRKIYPRQILVEYDEFSSPSKVSKARIESAHKALLANGYRLIHFDYPSNFLYTNL